jgi:hypothetical protein
MAGRFCVSSFLTFVASRTVLNKKKKDAVIIASGRRRRRSPVPSYLDSKQRAE